MANNISPDQLINQMRLLAAQAKAPGVETAAMGANGIGQPAKPSGVEFQKVLVNALDSVNETQQAASSLATRFEQGDAAVELSDVMVSLQKANVAFEAATQVRNKLVSAYQEIMNMPV